MADSAVSGLTAATTVADANEIPINEAGTSKKITALQLKAYMGDSLQTGSVADQVISATTAYVTGSALAVPVGKLRIGTVLRWRLIASKSAAGSTAGCVVIVKLGTLGTTGDTSVLTFTLGTPTAAADVAFFDVEVMVRGPLTASCILQGSLRMDHNLAATGFSTLPDECQTKASSAFDVTTANLIAGLVITTTSLSVWTVTSVSAEAKNL